LLQQQSQAIRDHQQSAAQQQPKALPEAHPDYAKLFPTVMDPLILTTLLNDVGRTSYLVKELGAGLNQSWVWLVDIPTYFQGLVRTHARGRPSENTS
jgi:hypothetical protein